MSLRHYITSIEKDVLYRKYTLQGLSPEKAHLRVDNVMEHLKSLVEAMKTKQTPSHKIEQKFREEFYKLCEREDK